MKQVWRVRQVQRLLLNPLLHGGVIGLDGAVWPKQKQKGVADGQPLHRLQQKPVNGAAGQPVVQVQVAQRQLRRPLFRPYRRPYPFVKPPQVPRQKATYPYLP